AVSIPWRTCLSTASCSSAGRPKSLLTPTHAMPRPRSKQVFLIFFRWSCSCDWNELRLKSTPSSASSAHRSMNLRSSICRAANSGLKLSDKQHRRIIGRFPPPPPPPPPPPGGGETSPPPPPPRRGGENTSDTRAPPPRR